MPINTETLSPHEKTVEVPPVTAEVSAERASEIREFEHRRQELIKEINERVPFLAYGLSQKLAENGLRGKVSVRSVMGEDWGVGVSKNNPRKDIPNVIIYPKNLLDQKRSVANAQLRHEIGHLNHSLGSELAQLREWCADNEQSYELMLPLIETVQTASVDYLEMRNSIADDPADVFRPLYTEVIDVGKIAEDIGSGKPYKQAVDMTLIHALSSIGLVPSTVPEIAADHASTDVNALFTAKTRSIIEQALKSSSGKIKVRLIRDYLWPEFSKLIPEGELSELSAVDEPGEANASDAVQQLLEKLQKNRRKLPEERTERQETNQELLRRLRDRAEKLQDELNQPESQEQSTGIAKQNSQDTPQEPSLEGIKEQLEKLQELIEQLNNPELIDQGEELEHFAYDIREVGIDEAELSDEQRELLGNLREFCQKTSLLYTKTMRFFMQQYQQQNPNFTNSMLERMMIRHHDTPSFTIYGRSAAKDFIENTSSELGIEQFDTEGFLLNFNLPKLVGRFWYRGGNGNLSQPVEEGEIEWGHFYRACMPAIWNSVDQTVRQGMLLDRINPFGQHDHKKYYYLYDVSHLPPEMLDEDASGLGGFGDVNEPMQGRENSIQEPHSEDESTVSESSSGENSADAESESGSQSSERPGSAEANGGEQRALGDSDQQDGMATDDLEDALQALQASLGGKSETGVPSDLEELINRLQQLQASGDDDNPSGRDRTYAEDSEVSNEESSALDNSEEQSEGGIGNSRELSELFGQLRDVQQKIESPLARSQAEDLPTQDLDLTDEELDSSVVDSIENLEQIKQLQQRQMEAFYREQSGLSGEALERYIDYREETRGLTNNLVGYFTDRFKLDKDYDYANNQRRGARLQRGWTNRILGSAAAGPVVDPAAFERKSIPKSPQLVWSLIIDNSGSCEGDIIEEEKKTAVALVEVAKRLNIPIEIVTFGGGEGYRFIKSFGQELFGDELAQLVRLDADQGTPDVVTLNAACESVGDFADQFNRSYNFVYFMTDGASGSGSIADIIRKFKRDMVITGIGLAGAAESIAGTWGRNSVGVEDVRQLSDVLIRKIEDQIEITFD